MATLVVWIVSALAVGAVLFGIAALLTGRATGLAEMPPDRTPLSLPADRLTGAEDLRAVRFDLAFRGYRMDQVDAVLDRVADDLTARDQEIAVLRSRLSEVPPHG